MRTDCHRTGQPAFSHLCVKLLDTSNLLILGNLGNGFGETGNVAEAEKQAAILRAEAKKEATMREAEGQAAAILRIQQANADGLRFIKEAAPDSAVLQLKSLEAFMKAADGKATKIIIPSEIQNVAGLAKSIAEIAKDQ